jgi:hypothetical protein
MPSRPDARAVPGFPAPNPALPGNAPTAAGPPVGGPLPVSPVPARGHYLPDRIPGVPPGSQAPHPQPLPEDPRRLTPTPAQYKRYGTIVRLRPEGGLKHMYPIWDALSAQRAVALIDNANPPLSPGERAAILGRAQNYGARPPGPPPAAPPPAPGGQSGPLPPASGVQRANGHPSGRRRGG